MSDLIEAFKLVGNLIGKLSELDQAKRTNTAKTFIAIARTFAAFPPAYFEKNDNEMLKLEAKTRGQLEALKSVATVQAALGKADAMRFFEAIEAVANAKELLSRGDHARDKIVLIIQAAGFFEGYAEVLDPDVLKAH
jgi:hypothetical protein